MERSETRLEVRLSDVDAFGVVWHGRYISYFEAGRTDLLRRFGLSAAQLKEEGFFPAIVSFQCDLLSPARDEQSLVVRCWPEPSEAARLTLRYEIVREDDGELVVRGTTTQVLIDSRGVLLYRFPPAVKERVEALLSALDGGGESG
ncbi:MAG: thioesterase family protein [Planctomycetota bacterium]|nr:thioesterase family protein [Planctomycetota bacterium]